MNAEENYQQILAELKNRASVKQATYRSTRAVFEELKSVLSGIAGSMQKDHQDPAVEVAYRENNQFEAQLKFSGDMLVASMHSNVFTFPEEHRIRQAPAVAVDSSAAYCGVIYIHNFLADSIKYNRLADVGYLVARIFVNRNKQFLVEGEGQLGFLWSEFSTQVMDRAHLLNIAQQAVLHCIKSDLVAPPFAAEKMLTLDQKQSMIANSGYPTGKHIGYRFRAELENENNVS
ncbi:hypothetical protein C7T94_11940 [Pedobacter yulinensis]|uniref:Uncharacterized protein n=1 Tax=Pedobacter yulinensis TaxID=2126353 RepID=A0A2T3HLJ2_9SPHI|nr:hypothetical protein [Pedobacter yulinensis]PST83286.1 hypothetical protein C7T94_11940 [Pedobacter yulinensis]